VPVVEPTSDKMIRGGYSFRLPMALVTTNSNMVYQANGYSIKKIDLSLKVETEEMWNK
jgi:hypothetical protein